MHDVDAQALPRQLRRVALLHDLDAVAVDDELVAVDRNRKRKRTVRRVVAREVRVRLRVAEIVDGDDGNLVAAVGLVQGPQNVAADSAVTVDRHFDRHDSLLLESINPSKAGEPQPPYHAKRRATETMRSTVNPKCSNSSFAGADAPKRSLPITSPCPATYRHQL